MQRLWGVLLKCLLMDNKYIGRKQSIVENKSFSIITSISLAAVLKSWLKVELVLPYSATVTTHSVSKFYFSGCAVSGFLRALNEL